MNDALVIIPIFNEQPTIRPVLEELASDYTGDILIVIDGSTDGSDEEVQAIIKEREVPNRIEIISHAVNQGYGRSLIDGFDLAIERDYRTVVTIDCDFQHEPKMVSEFLARAGDATIISGSRYLPESKTSGEAPKDRPKINKIITEEVNKITGYSITDAFCGFKAYRVCALRKLKLTEHGYAFPVQLWIQAWCAGLTVTELAVARIYVNVGRTFGGGLDDPDRRLRYYHEVLEREVNRCRAK